MSSSGKSQRLHSTADLLSMANDTHYQAHSVSLTFCDQANKENFPLKLGMELIQ